MRMVPHSETVTAYLSCRSFLVGAPFLYFLFVPVAHGFQKRKHIGLVLLRGKNIK